MRRLLLGAVILAGCAGSAPRGGADLAWTPVDSLDARLPASVRVFAGVSEADTLRAWAVRLDGARLDVSVAADTSDGREAPTMFAERTGACVALNAGYFDMQTGGPVGLVVDGGRLRSPAFDRIERDGVAYPVARGAVGIGPDGVEIASARDDGAQACRVERPVGNREGAPASVPACETWDLPEAVGAGPVLVRDGRVAVATEAEVFFGTSIPARHPRSAVGVTGDGVVWLVVVDGRQPASRGVTLEELAEMMHRLGAEDALNLDGGGSSALVVRPRGGSPVRLNLPTGYDVEREVATALLAFCD
ncbi:MAG: phosphodiester glycosidase family protein [Bacteroidota bacterium]